MIPDLFIPDTHDRGWTLLHHSVLVLAVLRYSKHIIAMLKYKSRHRRGGGQHQ